MNTGPDCLGGRLPPSLSLHGITPLRAGPARTHTLYRLAIDLNKFSVTIKLHSNVSAQSGGGRQGYPTIKFSKNTSVKTNLLTWDECILLGNIHIKFIYNFEISVLNLLASWLNVFKFAHETEGERLP